MTDDAQFEWHPIYAGRTYESVQRELADSIRSDQRAYHGALDNAEREEFGAFAAVRDIEKRWSSYDLGWAEMDADTLAQRITTFERAREYQQAMISWDEWRGMSPTPSATASTEKTDWRENLTDEQRRKLASAIAITILVMFFVLVVIILTVVF